MTGTAFGAPTNNYTVDIDEASYVSVISADMQGIRTMADLLGMISNISSFFPKKDDAQSFKRGDVIREAWRADNNAGIRFFFSSGRGLISDTVSISFHSPKKMTAIDNANASSIETK